MRFLKRYVIGGRRIDVEIEGTIEEVAKAVHWRAAGVGDRQSWESAAGANSEDGGEESSRPGQ